MKRFGRIRSYTQSLLMTTWAFKSFEGMEDAGACMCARKRCMKCRLKYFSPSTWGTLLSSVEAGAVYLNTSTL